MSLVSQSVPPDEPPANESAPPAAPGGPPPAPAGPPPAQVPAGGWTTGPAAGWGAPPPPGEPGWGRPGGEPGNGWGPPAPTYGAYGWGGPPPAPKPGSIPLRPLGVGDILEGLFSILRRYPAATIGSAAVVFGVVAVLQILLLLPTFSSLGDLSTSAESGDLDAFVTQVESIPWVAVLVGASLVALLSFALYALLAGVLATVVGRSAVGARLTFAEAWSRVLPRLGRLILASLLVTVLVGMVWVGVALMWVVSVAIDAGLLYALAVLVTLSALPVSVFLGVKLALTTPAVALESTAEGPIGPLTGLRRAWTLTRAAWWRTFGILLLGAVIAGALSQVVAIPLGIIVSAVPFDPQVAIVVATLTGVVSQAVAVPVSGLVLGLVYVDRRIRAERLDVALARAAGIELPPTSAPPRQ